MKWRQAAYWTVALLLAAAPADLAALAPATEEIAFRDAPPREEPSWPGPEAARIVERPGGSHIYARTEIVQPSLTLVRPAAGTANGTAVLVLPGGAFQALAWDLEGTEIADWLTQRGVTVFLLKYRVGVPRLPGGATLPEEIGPLLEALEPNRRLALADAVDAVRFVRREAGRFGVRPDQIGMIGFSAGAITTLGVLCEGDAAARPDFAAAIYGRLPPRAEIPADAPPLFLAAAADDAILPASDSAAAFLAWTRTGRSAELHIYARGGHGFGMRPQGLPVDRWPAAFEAWLTSQGALKAGAASPRR